MPRRIPLLLLGLLFAMVGPAQADSARDHLQYFYDEVETMRASFEQVRVRDDGRETDRSHGTVSIQRPGLFRFEYTRPYEQLYVSDGRRVWSYDPDLAQVLIQGMDETLGSTPAVLLSGDEPLEETFRMVEAGSGDGRTWVELEPREGADTQFERVRIGFDGDRLSVLEIIDMAGQTSRMSFADVEYGIELDAARFRFEPPEGTDVIDGSER